jgi:hypothetical protein
MEIVQAAVANPDVDVAKISALLALKERMEARDAEKQFNAAFAAALLQIPRVAKKGKKDMKEKGCIYYATYEDLDAAIRPVESKHGFARSFSTRVGDKAGIILALRLTHTAGHSVTSERYCPPDPGPGRNETQAIGSGESYGRRYLTLSIWNVVTVGADDDGASAEPITDEQAMIVRDCLSVLAMTPPQTEKFWAWAGARSPETIQRGEYAKVLAWLKQRCEKVGPR